jgi:hypothetical protein
MIESTFWSLAKEVCLMILAFLGLIFIFKSFGD